MTNSKEMIWSPQQQAFLDWCENGKGSAVLEARAGTGKSTTIVEGARRIRGQVALVAYNTSAGKELKNKLANAGLDWKKAQGGTVHSFCFSAWRKSQNGNVRVEEYKVRDLVDVLLPRGHADAAFGPTIVQLVSLARQTGIGISGGPVNDVHSWLELADHFDVFDERDGNIPDLKKVEVVQMAQGILKQSSEMLNIIDFDDMIYLPLLYKVRFWQFDVVMVDEAQDTNATRRMAVKAMLKRGGRLIAVGDRHQAIYGFTGADADALDLIAKEHNCVNLPLTVSYRCP